MGSRLLGLRCERDGDLSAEASQIFQMPGFLLEMDGNRHILSLDIFPPS